MKAIHQRSQTRPSLIRSSRIGVPPAAKICGTAGLCLMVFTTPGKALELRALDACVSSAPLPPSRPIEFTPRADGASASVPLPPRRDVADDSMAGDEPTTADVPLPPRREIDDVATADVPLPPPRDVADAAVTADVPLPPRRDVAETSVADTSATERAAPPEILMAEAVPMPPPRPKEFQSEDLSGAKQPSQTASAAQESKSDSKPNEAKSNEAKSDEEKSDESKPATPPAPQPPVATAQDNDELRARILASGKLVAESLPPLAAPGACGITSPVKLSAINVGDDKVTIAPPVVMRASLAEAVADWVRYDLAPAFAIRGDKLAKIDGAGAYQCRNRDHLANAKLSEHARGNAMDITAFVTAKGKHLELASITSGDVGDMPSLPTLMKVSACRRFMTVLGPGADAFHAEHLHVDLEARRSGRHLCQWAVPQVSAELRD